MIHKETGIQVDPKPVPTTSQMGAQVGSLNYIDLPALIELKLAAGRPQDEADVVQLIRCQTNRLDEIRTHLRSTHADYVEAFERLVALANEIDS